MEISIRGDKQNSIGLIASNERGQSLTEYILMLFISVALILGLMFEFSTAFQSWANNYFGDYLTCLLETGDLPSVGGTPGDSGLCNQFFQTFSLRNGRPSIALNKGSNDQPQTSGGSRGRTPGQRDSRSNGGSSSSGGNWNPTGNGGSNSAQIADNEAEKGGANNTGNMNASSGGDGSRKNISSGDGGRQLDGRIAVGRIAKDDETKKGYAPNLGRSDDMAGSPKRVRLKARRAPAQIADDQPMTFGNFIRILIIAALIIALVVVIGGQVLSATKGMDAD